MALTRSGRTNATRVLLAMLALACCWPVAPASGSATGGAGGLKTIRYHGYRVAVPSGWPVFDVAAHPGVCVRFNRHAVYLGRPGAEQRCPAHAVGRTEAILLAPGGGARSAAASGAAGSALPGGSAVTARVGDGRVAVTATWGGDPSVIARALGLRSVSGVAARLSSAARSRPASPSARAQAVKPRVTGTFTGLGFDACSAPSEDRMAAWSGSPYGTVGIYIGGANMACAQPNLSSTWVADETAQGWRFIPTYVGLQAPRNDCGCAAINSSHAASEGRAAAMDAVAQASAVGLGRGNPLYFDMEGYTRTSGNTSAVLRFLSGWTSQLHAQGYLSGVYSGANSGIRDLAGARGSGISEPDDIWMADWNGVQSTASPYVPAGDWSNHARLHQFEGDHEETHGGVRMSVDSNYVDGATAGAASSSPPPFFDGTYVQITGSQDVYEVVGEAPLYVSPPYWSALGPQPVTAISQKDFSQLEPAPTDGTFLKDSNGVTYRVAGGAPLFVSDPAAYGNPPAVPIDQWDIANLGNPAAHLNDVPDNGTFLTTATGAIYRVAGGAPLAIGGWSHFGGAQPAVVVDQADIPGAGVAAGAGPGSSLAAPGAHLAPVPTDGTAVEGLPSRTYWVFAGGHRRLTSPSLAAVQVDDAGLAPFPAVPCVVPRLRQLSLLGAKRTLLRADCGVGSVHVRRHRASGRLLHVVRQAVPAHTRLAAGYRVAIALG